VVGKDTCLYLFAGQDSLSKEAKLKSLRCAILGKVTPDFNLDILYARELSLKLLQEKMLFLPAGSGRRMVLIKDVSSLRKEAKDFLILYLAKPHPRLTLVLDTEHFDPRDDFLRQVSARAHVLRFREELRVDTFSLSRQIDLKKTEAALKILHRLLEEGERPERILGGLRYAVERTNYHPAESKKRFKFLLNCDTDIKTGRIKADFALERLVVALCAGK